MKRCIKDLIGYKVYSSDGEIGHTDNFFFDDERWVIRYFVINTGRWLSGSRIPISPILIERIEWEKKELHLYVKGETVQNSPDVDTTAPISRKIEATLSEHYGYPIYWGESGIWGGVMTPRALARKMTPEEELALLDEKESDRMHMRSTYEVTGYHMQAKDGEIGHLEDFVLDDASWEISHIIVDTKNWLPGRKVLVEPHTISGISWSSSKVYVDLERETIEKSPEVHEILEEPKDDSESD